MAHQAYSYLRFSSPEQAEGDSRRRQTSMAVEYASRKGLELDTKLTFHDLGVSAYRGKNAETGQLANFLQAVKVGLVPKGSYLLVESLDRISRQAARKALRVLEELCEEDIVVVTLSDNREYTKAALDNDPMSLIMSLLIFIRANEESAQKARRIKAAWTGKRLKIATEPLTAKGPGWLTLDPATRKWVINAERAKVVKKIFAMTLKGIGQHAIAEYLNREKTPVFGTGTRWHRSYIAKLLQFSAVMGTYVPQTIEFVEGKRTRKPLAPVPGYFPAIVDEEDFMRVQAMRIDSNNSVRGKAASAPVLYNIFGGLLRCSRCGDSAIIVNKGAGNGERSVVCSKAKAGAGCRYTAVKYPLLERSFLENYQSLLGAAPGSADPTAIDGELAQLEGAIYGTEDALEALSTGYAKTRISSLLDQMAAMEAERDRLKAQRETLLDRREAVVGPLVARRIDDLSKALLCTPMARGEVNAIMRQVFSGVKVNATAGTLGFVWKHGGESEVIFRMPKDSTAKAQRGKPAESAPTQHLP